MRVFEFARDHQTVTVLINERQRGSYLVNLCCQSVLFQSWRGCLNLLWLERKALIGRGPASPIRYIACLRARVLFCRGRDVGAGETKEARCTAVLYSLHSSKTIARISNMSATQTIRLPRSWQDMETAGLGRREQSSQFSNVFEFLNTCDFHGQSTTEALI